METQNRWRTRAGPALFAAITAILCPGQSHAQQPTLTPPQQAAHLELRLTHSGFDDQTALQGATLSGQSATTGRLSDFARGAVVRNDADPNAPIDTSASLEPDTRPQRDRDAFENPPAGHDPKYFQIEIEPLKDRRTREFFEADPYQHLGWRLGSFILLQEFELAPAWRSNVLLSSNARSDWRADFRSETRLVSDWTNHALELRMLQDRSFYRKFSNENNAEQTYELRGRIDIRRSTNIEALAAHEVSQESRNSVDASGSATLPRADVLTNRFNLAFNHRFNRLSLQLRGGHSDTSYEQVSSSLNGSRDVTATTAAVRAQWEFRPTFSVFGEFEYDDRHHSGIPSSDGLNRSSDGERYRAGVALGQSGEILRGEASIGYGTQRLNAAALPDIGAFLLDANVAWRITPLTSLLLDARTSFGETTLAGSPGVIERRTGISVRHALRRNLIGEAGASYSTQNYQNTALVERSLTVNANVEYSLSRHAALFSRYEHTRFWSSNAARDYDVGTFMFGARLRN